MMRTRVVLLVGSLLLLLLVAGCGPSSPAASLTRPFVQPTATVVPTETPSPQPSRPTLPLRTQVPTPTRAQLGPLPTLAADAVIGLPPEGEPAAWSPVDDTLAWRDGTGVFLASGPSFESQEVLRFPTLMDGVLLDWSPDGVYLAALFFKDSNGAILQVLNTVDLEQVVEITRPAESPRIGPMAWSPDSRHLAYADFLQVTLIDVQKAGPEQTSPADKVMELSWSPGGQYLATLSTGCPHSRLCSLKILDVEGNIVCEQAITGTYNYGGLEQWLDEETLTWGHQCGTGCYGHRILDVAHCRQTLDTMFGASYDWRPAGDYAAVGAANVGYQAYLMDRQGLVRPIGQSPEPMSPDYIARLNQAPYLHTLLGWSPGGQELLYATSTNDLSSDAAHLDSTCGLWTATVPQLTTTLLLTDTCYAEWSPDGGAIAFFALGEPILDDADRMIDTRFDPHSRQEPNFYLGVLDLETGRVPFSMPFVADLTDYPSYWRGGPGLFNWSGDGCYLVANMDDYLYLWQRGDRSAVVVPPPPDTKYVWLPSWSADSTAFYFGAYLYQGETPNWIVRP